MTKRRIIFSLASLLIVSTAIVVFLGYAEWRRMFEFTPDAVSAWDNIFLAVAAIIGVLPFYLCVHYCRSRWPAAAVDDVGLNRRRFRFSLAGLLLVTTAIVLFIGLSQARRRSILREADELRAGGAAFAIDYRLLDKIWLQRPTDASIHVQQLPAGKYKLRSKVYTADEAIAYGKSLQKRLEKFGVESVDINLTDRKNTVTELPYIGLLRELGAKTWTQFIRETPK